MDLIDLPCIFLILLGLAISIYYRHVYGWVIRNIGISMKPSMKPSMKLPMKSHEAMDQQRSISCTQLHSAASFLQKWGQVCSIHHLRVLLCGLLIAWHPGTPMIWNDLKWSEVSRPPNHASLMFLMIFEKHWIFKGYNNMIYNDWTTGNMNSVSFTKTLENFDMESQKLGFRAVPTGNGNFWGTGVRCTGEEFHNRSLFRQQTCNMSSIALPSGKLT